MNKYKEGSYFPMFKAIAMGMCLAFLGHTFAQPLGDYGPAEKRAYEYYSRGEFKKAIILYRKAQKLGAPAYLTSFNIGNSYFRAEEFALAASAYKKSIRLMAENPEIFLAPYFNLAAVLYRLKDYGGSIAAYHRALDLDPENFDSWLYLAEVYSKTEDWVGMERALEKARSLDSTDVSVVYQLSELFLKQQNPEISTKLVREAYTQNSEEVDFLFYLGDIYRLQKKYPEAIAAYREGLLVNPDKYNVYYKLADVLDLDGKKFLAMDALQKALAIKSDYSDASVFLGNLAFDLKWWQKAGDAYQQAAENGNEEGIQGLRNTAYELELQGTESTNKKGLEYLKKALELRPNNSELQEEIKSWETASFEG